MLSSLVLIFSLNVCLLLQPWSPKEQDGGLSTAPSVIPVHTENPWWIFLKDEQADYYKLHLKLSSFPLFPQVMAMSSVLTELMDHTADFIDEKNNASGISYPNLRVLSFNSSINIVNTFGYSYLRTRWKGTSQQSGWPW